MSEPPQRNSECRNSTTLADGNEWSRPARAQNPCQGPWCDGLPLGRESLVDLLRRLLLLLGVVLMEEVVEEEEVVVVVAW